MSLGDIALWFLVGVCCCYFIYQFVTAELNDDRWQIDEREDFTIDVRRKR